MSEQDEALFTTIVGSFPLENTPKNMAIALNDQINLGIDFPCYPQLISMTDQFLSPLSEVIPELRKENGKFILSDDFELPDTPLATEYGEFVINFLRDNPRLKRKIKGIKACLTGPFTLTSEVILEGKIAQNVKPRLFNEPRAIMVDWIVDKFASIMKEIGKHYDEMGFNIISMDEPILGLLVGKKVMFYSSEFVVDSLNKAISDISRWSSIHVCGRISPNLRDLLLKTDVNILDHEFITNKGNFDLFEKAHFEDFDKYLALGTVATQFKPKEEGTLDDYVESVEEIQKIIEKGINLYGKENLFIKPDCGFKPLKDSFEERFAYEITMKKLNNMVLAANIAK
ncbi:MAG: hypothetical protein GF317_10970 [Candidatus Lokiarchaeota archaeon]|nr:hypothetical protein [Candidatus Lokiarchaeota archaeon]MBD3200184.1 hypothetical protein [Candidatus Lokiarchaeota archaeon]